MSSTRRWTGRSCLSSSITTPRDGTGLQTTQAGSEIPSKILGTISGYKGSRKPGKALENRFRMAHAPHWMQRAELKWLQMEEYCREGISPTLPCCCFSSLTHFQELQETPPGRMDPWSEPPQPLFHPQKSVSNTFVFSHFL